MRVRAQERAAPLHRLRALAALSDRCREEAGLRPRHRTAGFRCRFGGTGGSPQRVVEAPGRREIFRFLGFRHSSNACDGGE